MLLTLLHTHSKSPFHLSLFLKRSMTRKAELEADNAKYAAAFKDGHRPGPPVKQMVRGVGILSCAMRAAESTSRVAVLSGFVLERHVHLFS